MATYNSAFSFYNYVKIHMTMVLLFGILIATHYFDPVKLESFFSYVPLLHFTLSSILLKLFLYATNICIIIYKERLKSNTLKKTYSQLLYLIRFFLSPFYVFYNIFLYSNLSLKEKTHIFPFLNPSTEIFCDIIVQSFFIGLLILIYFSNLIFQKSFLKDFKINSYVSILNIFKFLMSFAIFLSVFSFCMYGKSVNIILVSVGLLLITLLFRGFYDDVIYGILFRGESVSQLHRHDLRVIFLICLLLRIMFEYSVYFSTVNNVYNSYLFSKEFYAFDANTYEMELN
ncbi:hypothetical protein TUBRATIS_11270 [Tubulinosema ratisbonensis]|uniref:Uncharacterized protein n=1 Tax=Tubulinosema ratisbonensis TaxID=291195 RepID=A0A437AMD7_9MICR|nr:hypothetical protein TUBRATIS_11270 [Tubulinosema ratisbonensis]